MLVLPICRLFLTEIFTMANIFETVSKILGHATGIAVVFMLSVAMVSLNYQVFTRYVIGRSASWSEELAMFLFTWSVLLIGSLGIREKFHVRLTFLLDLFPGKVCFALEKILHLLTFGFGLIFAYSGVHYVQGTVGQISAAVRYPIEWLHVAAPVTGVLITVHAIAHIFRPAEFEL